MTMFEPTEVEKYFREKYDPECGAYIPPGWEDLVLKAEAVGLALYPHDFHVTQIKEKFGGLRFYFTPFDKLLVQLINVIEQQSFHVCEWCGKPGELRKEGWYRTLCDVHLEEEKQGRRSWEPKLKD